MAETGLGEIDSNVESNGVIPVGFGASLEAPYLA